MEKKRQDLPEHSEILADKAYNHHEIEDVLAEANLDLRPIRKKNSLRRLPPWKAYLVQHYRKIIETAGSMIERLFLLPKSIDAVTAEGFELKVVLFTLASRINCL